LRTEREAEHDGAPAPRRGKNMMASFVLVFVCGALFGNAVRLLYYCATGRDIPLLKPEYEAKRLRAEADRIESANNSVRVDE
jgi:hypothetical protein